MQQSLPRYSVEAFKHGPAGSSTFDDHKEPVFSYSGLYYRRCAVTPGLLTWMDFVFRRGYETLDSEKGAIR